MSISLVQDASAGWLAVRYGVCNEEMRSQQGMLGVARLAALKQCHALKLRECTLNIIKRACAPTEPMPFSKTPRKHGCNMLQG